eukprot:1128965-Prorocentrum_minimum.AAC.2
METAFPSYGNSDELTSASRPGYANTPKAAPSRALLFAHIGKAFRRANNSCVKSTDKRVGSPTALAIASLPSWFRISVGTYSGMLFKSACSSRHCEMGARRVMCGDTCAPRPRHHVKSVNKSVERALWACVLSEACTCGQPRRYFV